MAERDPRCVVHYSSSGLYGRWRLHEFPEESLQTVSTWRKWARGATVVRRKEEG